MNPLHDLSVPFEFTEELAKGGRKFTYIPVSEVIDRLNRVIGLGNWSWSVNDRWKDDAFVIVQGCLLIHLEDVGAARFDGIGGQKINRNQQGEPIDIGDDWKGAASDALKKAAQHAGVGLYLARPGRAFIRDLEDAINSLDDEQRGALKGRWATSDIPSLNRLREEQAIFVYDMIEDIKQGRPEPETQQAPDPAGDDTENHPGTPDPEATSGS